MKIRKMDRVLLKIIVMLIPIFEPKIFTQFNSTTAMYIILNLIELSYFLFTFLLAPGKPRRVHWPFIGWVGCQGYWFVSMLLTGHMGGILQWGYLSIMVANLIFVFECALYDGNVLPLLKGITVLGTAFLYINFITLLIWPNGIIEPDVYYMADSAQFFLGIKTAFTTMMYPTIASAGTLYLINRDASNRRGLLLAIIACLINIFYKNISTAIVGTLIIITMLLLRKIIKVKWKFSWLFTGAIIAQIAIVYFDLQSLFSTFIETYLHKDATLSSRVNIWRSAKALISEESIFNLLFGNGSFELHRFVPYGGGTWQPHNQLLVWLYSMGIVGTLIVFIFLIRLGKWKVPQDQVYYFLSIVCSSVVFLSVTEVYFDVAVCFAPFLIIYYIGKSFEWRRIEICHIE